MMKNTIISIAGSIIYPNTGINVDFLRRLSVLIRRKILERRDSRFFLVIGGGYVEREYQYAAEQVVGKVKASDFDWLGVRATELNAHLVRTIFRDIVKPEVIDKYDIKIKVGGYRLIVCSGWQPGWTTDYDMVLLANQFKVDRVFSLVNVSYIYDKDPKLFPDAKPLTKLNWDDYRNMIGGYWSPQRQLPFDPFASKLAQQTGLTVVFLHGRDLENVKNVLEGKKFIGTILEPDDYL